MIEELIKSFGLPTAMCLWFMYKTDKVVAANTIALGKNTEALSNFKKNYKN